LSDEVVGAEAALNALKGLLEGAVKTALGIFEGAINAVKGAIDGITGAVYANPSRGGIAVHTSVKMIAQAESDDQSIGHVRILTTVRYRRGAGAS
jgi:hypothetical protein